MDVGVERVLQRIKDTSVCLTAGLQAPPGVYSQLLQVASVDGAEP